MNRSRIMMAHRNGMLEAYYRISVAEKIRERFTVGDELAILRGMLSDAATLREYMTALNEIHTEVKAEFEHIVGETLSFEGESEGDGIVGKLDKIDTLEEALEMILEGVTDA